MDIKDLFCGGSGSEDFVDDGILSFAEENGGVPFYLFRTDRALDNLTAVRECLGNQTRIAYSVKANPWIAEAVSSRAEYLEVCSAGELEFCRLSGISGDKIVLDGVYRDDALLECALSMRVKRIVINSAEQMRIFLELPASIRKPELLLRVSSGNQFGMEKKEAAACVRMCENRSDIHLSGIQYYPGTQRQFCRQMKQDLHQLDEWICFFENRLPGSLRVIEFGAGIGTPCFDGEEYGEYLSMFQMLSEYVKERSCQYQVVYESGRNIAASSGIYVTKVFAIRRICGRKTIFCHGGINHLNYDGGILGIRTPYISVRSRHPLGTTEACMVCGSLCSESDVLARNAEIDCGIEAGDYICFENAGAYAATSSPNLFLTMEMPAVILYNKDAGSFQDSVRMVRSRRSTVKLLLD